MVLGCRVFGFLGHGPVHCIVDALEERFQGFAVGGEEETIQCATSSRVWYLLVAYRSCVVLFFLERSPRGCTPPNLRPEIFRRCPVVVFLRLMSVLVCLVVVCWYRLTLLPSHCPGLFLFVFRQDRSLASTPSRSSRPPFGREPTRTPFAVSGVGLGRCWFARPTAVPRFHRSTRRPFLCERSHYARGRFRKRTRTSREGSPWGDEDVSDLLPCPTQGGRGVGRDQLGRRIPSPPSEDLASKGRGGWTRYTRERSG